MSFKNIRRKNIIRISNAYNSNKGSYMSCQKQLKVVATQETKGHTCRARSNLRLSQHRKQRHTVKINIKTSHVKYMRSNWPSNREILSHTDGQQLVKVLLNRYMTSLWSDIHKHMIYIHCSSHSVSRLKPLILH